MQISINSVISISRLTRLSSSKIRELKSISLIVDGNDPIAVLIPYQEYMEQQNLILSLNENDYRNRK